MAVLAAPSNVAWQSQDGTAKSAVFAFRKVTTGDTFDVGPYGFNTVFGGLFMASTQRTAVPVVCAIAGTVVTISSTGVAADGGYLFVQGD